MKSLKEKESVGHTSAKKQSVEKVSKNKEKRSSSKKKKSNKKKKFKIDPTTDPRHQRCAEKLFKALNQVVLKNLMVTLYQRQSRLNEKYAHNDHEEEFSKSRGRSKEDLRGDAASQSQQKVYGTREKSEENRLFEFASLSRGQSEEKTRGVDHATPDKNTVSQSKKPVNSSAKREITELIEKQKANYSKQAQSGSKVPKLEKQVGEFIISDKIEIENLTKKRTENHACKPSTEKFKGGRVREEAKKAKVELDEPAPAEESDSLEDFIFQLSSAELLKFNYLPVGKLD